MMETRNRLLGTVSLICLIVTVIWLALLIYDIAAHGPVETYDQALASVADLDGLHYLTYANAALITLTATMLFAGLYVLVAAKAPLWAAMGAAFVPVYALLNLFAYLSQITIVPNLVALGPASEALLAQMVQAWPSSAVGVLNGLAYAVLGIPSIIFGLLLDRVNPSLRVAGIVLALSGAASIVGMIGVAVQSAVLGLGSIAGGGLFLAALIPLTVVFLKNG